MHLRGDSQLRPHERPPRDSWLAMARPGDPFAACSPGIPDFPVSGATLPRSRRRVNPRAEQPGIPPREEAGLPFQLPNVALASLPHDQITDKLAIGSRTAAG